MVDTNGQSISVGCPRLADIQCRGKDVRFPQASRKRDTLRLLCVNTGPWPRHAVPSTNSYKHKMIGTKYREMRQYSHKG